MKQKIVLAIALAVSATCAQALPVTWTLSDVTFVDDSTASGSFSFDADTNTYLSWNITTTSTVHAYLNGFTSLLGATYSTNALTNASTNWYLNPSALGVQNVAGNRFGLTFLHPLTNAGGTVALGGSKGYEFAGFNSRSITGGSVSAAAVPEPASYALMLGGLVLVVGLALRRKN
jgi:hypothetical protein